MTAAEAASRTDKPFLTLTDYIARHAAERPDARALSCEGENRSWAELHVRLDRVAAALAGLGVARGDRVAVLASPSVPAVEALFGALRAGGCMVPLSGSVTADALAGMIADCAPRVLVASADMRMTLAGFEQDLMRDMPGRLVALDFAAPGWLPFEAWLAAADPAVPPAVPRRDDPFNIIYSSGTTGRPKGILHDHDMRARQAERRNFGFGPDSVSLYSTPLYSNTTLQPLLGSVVAGGLTVLMRKFDAGRYLEIAAAERVTHTMLVPVQFQRILARPDFDAFDLSAFKVKLSTGAAFRPELKREVLARWPGRLVEIYGMTEGGSTCLLDAGAHPDKLHTVGRPAPGTELRLIDEDGRELPPGAIGEVVGRSPYMMRGYFGRPAETGAFHWRDRDGRIWHRTGDIGRFDEDGFLILLDRKKDVIISGGFNIYASDLEGVLLAHPDIADAAVIGVPSAAWAETPLGFVVPKPGVNAVPDEVLAWANARLGKTQRLSAVRMVDEIPRSPAGKILKRELRDA